MLFFILQQITGMFFARDWYAISLAQNFVLLARNSCLRKEKCFPNLKEHDISNAGNTPRSMIPESGIIGRLHQSHFSRLRRAFPLTSPPLGLLRSPIFFAVSPRFLPSLATADPGPRLINKYSSSPNGLWVNSPWGRRPNGLLTRRPWRREE